MNRPIISTGRLSATNIYWATANGPGGLYTTPLGGGPVTMLAAGGTGTVTLDTANLYWMSGTSSGFDVMKMPLAGGPAATLATLSDDSGGAQWMAVGSAGVYWTEQPEIDPQLPTATAPVLGIGLSGGRPITLASGVSVPGAIAADATNVYWVTGGTLVNDYHDATVMKVSARGGLATTLASNQAGYAAMGIAVDAASVYWTNYDGGTVMKVAICGGALTTLASGQNRPAGIAVDSSSVYWTTWADGSNGTVMKATPK